MNSDFTSPPRARKPKNFLPEIAIAALLFAGGAWFWTHNQPPAPTTIEGVAQAQTAPDEPKWKAASAQEKRAAERVILAQLEAFKANDWKQAETYQAAGLKESFASTEQFEQVIKTTYPQFANYKSVSWKQARASGPLLQIQIALTGEDDVQIAALYSMVKENVGTKDQPKWEYRVSGVSGGSAQISDAKTV